jgi:hypothetical protein
MIRSRNRTTRNTAGLFSPRRGRPARLAFSPLTLRSDSARLVRLNGGDPDVDAYYFYGLSQDNQHNLGPNTLGTVEGNTILVRGKVDGDWQSEEDLISTFTHESSHLLVSAYGEHPRTDVSAASFDRYRDEFRAYWIEPVGPYAGIRDADRKARKIKQHLVGRNRRDMTGYEDLHNRYWNRANAAFRAQIDGHTRPDGFNLSNSPDQDRFFEILSGIGAGTTTVDDAVLLATRMSPLDRRECSTSPLIRRLYGRLDADDAGRIRNALAFPQSAEGARELNPTRSGRVQSFLETIALRDSAELPIRYGRLNAPERESVSMNLAVWNYTDRHLDWGPLRASTYAMVNSKRVDQFDAMDDFLDACLGAQVIASVERGMATVPDDVQTALDRLVYTSRLALYRRLETVRREYVDALPQPVRGRLLHALREEGEL